MSRIIGAIGLLVGVAGLVATSSAQTEEGFSLTVRLKGHYDPKITVCAMIRTAEPFEVVLADGKTRTVVFGKLGPKKKRAFPLKLEVSQGKDDHWIFDKLFYELEVGAAAAQPVTVETSNHPAGYDLEISLARGLCPLDDEVSK